MRRDEGFFKRQIVTVSPSDKVADMKRSRLIPEIPIE
jgi:hypothetical protein